MEDSPKGAIEEFQKRAQALCDEFRSYGGEMVACLTIIDKEPDKEAFARWDVAYSVGSHPEFPQLMFQKGETLFCGEYFGYVEMPSDQ